jgi:hypothetical protein
LDDVIAYKLTELFKRWSSEKKLTSSELAITFITATGSEINVHPSTPHNAASYLRYFKKGDNPLFIPGDVRCETKTEMRSRPGSILFKGFGYIRDNANLQHYKTMLHINFTGVTQNIHQVGEIEARGYISFDDDFDDDPLVPMHAHNGPTLHEFIRALESAGNNWSNMCFRTDNMRLNAGGAPLQLIKK